MLSSLRRTWVLATGALSLALVSFGSALAQAPNQPVRIGVIGPFTGPSSDFGNPMLNGIQLAMEEINAVGGFLGRPFELVIRDDQGNPEVGFEQAKSLMKEGVIATIGFCNTGVALKAIEIFQAAKSPLIVPCATGTPITARYPAAESYIFRTSARDAIQAPFVVNDLVKRGWTKVAIFADATGYGDSGLKDVEAALAAKNLKAVYVARFPLGVKDLTPELKAAREAGANAIFSYTVGPENAAIALGKKALQWDVPQVGAWPLSFPFFLNGAGSAANDALMSQSFIAEPSNERRAAFISAYARKFNIPMTVPMAAAQSYDTTFLLLHSLFSIRSGKFEGPAIKEALENLPKVYYGVVATYEKPFSNTDHDAITSNMLVMGKIKDGKVTFAYPDDAKRNLFIKRKQ